ncbi:hypothetical protein ACHAQA_002181 [Verticillium albo-atrum]
MPALSMHRAMALTISALALLAVFCDAATIPGGVQISKNDNHNSTILSVTLGGRPIEDLGFTWNEADGTFTPILQHGKTAHAATTDKDADPFPRSSRVTAADTHLMDSYMQTASEPFYPQCNWPKASMNGLAICMSALRLVPDHVWRARVPVDVCTIRDASSYVTVTGSAWLGAPGGAHATSLEVVEALEWVRETCGTCKDLSCFAGGAKAVGKNSKFVVKVNGTKRRDDPDMETKKERDISDDGVLAARNTDIETEGDEWDECTWPKGPVRALIANCVVDQLRHPWRVYKTTGFIEICRVEGTEVDVEGKVETLQINGFVKEGAEKAEARAGDIIEAIQWMRENCSTCRAARNDCYVGGFKAVGTNRDFIVQIAGGKKKKKDISSSSSVDTAVAQEAGERIQLADETTVQIAERGMIVARSEKSNWEDKCTWPRGPQTSIDECMAQMKRNPERVFKTSTFIEVCRVKGTACRHSLTVMGYVKGAFTEGEATADEVWQTLRWASRYCTSCHASRDDCYLGGWWLTGEKENFVVQITGSAKSKDSVRGPCEEGLGSLEGLAEDHTEDHDGITPGSPLIEPPRNITAGDEDTPMTLDSPVVYKYGHPENNTQYLFGPDRQPLGAFNITWADLQQAGAGSVTPEWRAFYDAILLEEATSRSNSGSSVTNTNDMTSVRMATPECHADQAPTNGTYAQACLDFLWANRDNTWDVSRRETVDICAVQVQTERDEASWRDVFRVYATTCRCRDGVRVWAGSAAVGLERMMEACSTCDAEGRCRLGATLTLEGGLRFQLHVVSYSEQLDPASVEGERKRQQHE